MSQTHFKTWNDLINFKMKNSLQSVETKSLCKDTGILEEPCARYHRGFFYLVNVMSCRISEFCEKINPKNILGLSMTMQDLNNLLIVPNMAVSF